MTMEDNKRRRRQQLTRLKATPGAPPAPPWRLPGSRGHPQPRPLLHTALDPVGQPLDPYPMRPPPHVCRSAWSPPPLLVAALVPSTRVLRERERGARERDENEEWQTVVSFVELKWT